MWPDPQETTDLVTFTEEILNGKLHLLCSVWNQRFLELLLTELFWNIRSFLTWLLPAMSTGSYLLLLQPSFLLYQFLLTKSSTKLQFQMIICTKRLAWNHNFQQSWAPTPQNGQTHSNYLSATARNCLSVFDYFVGLVPKGLCSLFKK